MSDNNKYQDFCRGLEYLSGTNVDVDKALALITKSAEAGLNEAYEKLVSMYNYGDGVSRNYQIAIEWQRKYISHLEQTYCILTKDSPFGYYELDELDELEKIEIEACLCQLLFEIELLGNFELTEYDLISAKNTFKKMYEYAVILNDNNWLSIACAKLGDICEAEENLSEAKAYYGKALEISQKIAEESGTIEARRDLSISYENLGDICNAEGNLSEAKVYYEKALEISLSIVEKSGTIQAYDDLAFSYYKIGNVSTNAYDKKVYYTKFKEISELLYENTGSSRYKQFLDIANFLINIIN